MNYSREKEAEMLEAKKKTFKKAIFRFGAGRKGGRVDPEDLMQEALVAYLQHIRRAKTEQEANRFSSIDVNNVCCRHVLKTMAYSYPKTNTTSFTKLTGSEMNYRTSLDVGEYDEEISDGTDVESIVEILDFIERLPEREKNILRLKYEGVSNCEIAKLIGVTPANITYLIKRTAAQYHASAA